MQSNREAIREELITYARGLADSSENDPVLVEDAS